MNVYVCVCVETVYLYTCNSNILGILYGDKSRFKFNHIIQQWSFSILTARQYAQEMTIFTWRFRVKCLVRISISTAASTWIKMSSHEDSILKESEYNQI